MRGGEVRRSEFSRRRFLQQGMGAAAVALGGPALLAACGDDDSRAEPAGGADGQPVQGGTVRAAHYGGTSTDTADAQLAFTTTDVAIAFSVFDQLMTQDPSGGGIRPGLAEEIAMEGSPDEWTIRLRPDVTWHDGRDLTVDDVIFSLRRLTDPDSFKPGGTDFQAVDLDGITKLDPLTARFKLHFGDVFFPEHFSVLWNVIVPVDFDPANPAGTGPFELGSLQPGERAVLTRNESYWGAPRPHLDEVVLINFADNVAAFNALMSGDADALTRPSPAQLRQLEGDDRFRIVRASETEYGNAFVMNAAVPPFDDVRVRQAFRLMVDRQGLVEQVLGGEGRVANDLFAPFDAAFAADLEREHDPDRARALLRDAGHDGLRLDVAESTGYLNPGLVVAFAEQAREAGVTINVQQVDNTTYFSRHYGQDPLFISDWPSFPLSSMILSTMLTESPFNEPQYTNERIDEIWTDARGDVDAGSREEKLHEIQRIQFDEGAYLVWSFRNQLDAVVNDVQGIEPHVSGSAFQNFQFEDWYRAR